MKSQHAILQEVDALLAQRGEGYDGAIGRACDAFQSLTGVAFPPDRAWLFMLLLKLARDEIRYKPDNLHDAIGYAALLSAVRSTNGGKE